MESRKAEKGDFITTDLLKAIFKAIPTHAYFKDSNYTYRLLSDTCRQFNQGFTGQDITGKTDYEIYEHEVADMLHRDDTEIAETKKGIHYVSHFSRDGETYYNDVLKEPVLDENGEVLGIVGIVHDITEMKKLELMQRERNRFDALTKLLSRNYYEERLQSILTENNLPLAVIIADTNRLKFINDHYGHVMGDDLLKHTADIMRLAVAESDEIFRIGGDEFVIFCPRTDIGRCREIIKRIKSMESGYEGYAFHTTTSLGYAVAESTDDSLTETITLAEKMMYEEKNKNNKARTDV